MFASTRISLGPTKSLVVLVSHEWARKVVFMTEQYLHDLVTRPNLRGSLCGLSAPRPLGIID